jgi:hypothetical protein
MEWNLQKLAVIVGLKNRYELFKNATVGSSPATRQDMTKGIRLAASKIAARAATPYVSVRDSFLISTTQWAGSVNVAEKQTRDSLRSTIKTTMVICIGKTERSVRKFIGLLASKVIHGISMRFSATTVIVLGHIGWVEKYAPIMAKRLLSNTLHVYVSG